MTYKYIFNIEPITEYLSQYGITIQQLSTDTGLSKGTLQRIINGDKDFRVSTLLILMNYTSVTGNSIFSKIKVDTGDVHVSSQ